MDLKSYAYGSRSDEQVHVFSYEKDNDVNDCEDCTVVFVHGGAWGSGKPWMYRLATEGICDAIPGASKGILIQYPVYPLATIFDQAECIIDAIEFVKSNARTLGMSKQTKFVLVGHSSGAHLSVLATIAASRKGRRLVDVVLGLSGVYDIGSHFDFEKNRGVHVISPMRSAALGPLNWDDCSPSLILQQYFEPAIGHQVDTSIIESEMSMGWPIRLFPKFFFLHGTRDATVPHSSTEKMEEVLAARGCDVHAIYADYEHIDPIVDLTMMDRNSTVSTALTQIRITSDELSTLNATSV
jgi:acetyl esterase/lipase